MATDVEQSEVDAVRLRAASPGVQQSRKPVNAERARVRLGQAHKPRDKQSSLAYLTRSLDDSCSKRRRARPAKKRHQHSTASDQSECGVSPYGTILRMKHGNSHGRCLWYRIMFLFLLLYYCSCLSVFLSVFGVLDAGVGRLVEMFLRLHPCSEHCKGDANT